MTKKYLKYGLGNAKLAEKTLTFSLPAGWTCPGAGDCKTMCHPEGRVLDVGTGDRSFRCFAAMDEARSPNARNARWYNYELLSQCGADVSAITALIVESLPAPVTYESVRVHASGDFYSQTYFDAWMLAARHHPELTFYAYTKSIPFWKETRVEIPDNFILKASLAGKYDEMAKTLPHVKIAWHPDELEGMPVDHDDSLAKTPDISFALMLHSVQPKGTDAASAVKRLKDEGIQHAYTR